jgi:Flp pilus assembly protein TadD
MFVQNASTYEARGLAKERKGDLDGAMADYNQAIKFGVSIYYSD